MPILFFKSKYLELVKQGKKTSTLRLTHKLKEHDTVTFLSGRQKAIANIDKITPIKFKDLTDDIAKMDGFESKKHLKKALKEIYKDTHISQLYLIEFSLR